MMDKSRPLLVGCVKRLVKHLVANDMRSVEKMTKGVRLTAFEIQEAIREYGGTLVTPPDTAFQTMDAIEIEGCDPKKWSIRFELWTAEENSSDLSLELTVTETVPEPRVELDNIHVL